MQMALALLDEADDPLGREYAAQGKPPYSS
jgi:hypothetical protein